MADYTPKRAEEIFRETIWKPYQQHLLGVYIGLLNKTEVEHVELPGDIWFGRFKWSETVQEPWDPREDEPMRVVGNKRYPADMWDALDWSCFN